MADSKHISENALYNFKLSRDKFIQRLDERKARNKKLASMDITRVEILKILYKRIPKTEDMKQRSEMIHEIADDVMEAIDGQNAQT